MKAMSMFEESQTCEIQTVDTIKICYEFNNSIRTPSIKYYECDRHCNWKLMTHLTCLLLLVNEFLE